MKVLKLSQKYYYLHVFLLFTLLCGCAVSFDKSKIKQLQGPQLSFSGPDCQVKFKVSVIRNEYQKQDRISATDYIDWTKEVLKGVGCSGILASGDEQAKLIITVTDNYIYAGTGAGIIAAITFYVIPLKETQGNRKVSIEYEDSVRIYESETNVWLGWYFLPFFPASFLNYDKYIFKDHLKSFLGENK